MSGAVVQHWRVQRFHFSRGWIDIPGELHGTKADAFQAEAIWRRGIPDVRYRVIRWSAVVEKPALAPGRGEK